MAWADTLRGHVHNFSNNVQSYLPDLNQQHHRDVSKSIGKQMSSDELLAHPEYPHVNWELEPQKREKIDVAAERGGPFKLAYELHGKGPSKIVVGQSVRRLTSALLTYATVDHGSRRLHEDMAAPNQRLWSHTR